MAKRRKGERPKKKHYKRPAPKKAGDGPAPNPAAEAIKYLEEWGAQSKGGAWRFAKTRQVYLLRHAYDCDALPDSAFDQLASYVAGLPEGAARAKTAVQAKAYAAGGVPPRKAAPAAPAPAAEPDGADAGAPAADTTALDEARMVRVRDRARRILKALGESA